MFTMVRGVANVPASDLHLVSPYFIGVSNTGPVTFFSDFGPGPLVVGTLDPSTEGLLRILWVSRVWSVGQSWKSSGATASTLTIFVLFRASCRSHAPE